MNHTVYLYVFDTMADWEVGYVTAELNSGRYYKEGVPASKIVTVAIDKTPIRTLGGLQIVPDMELAECHMRNADALILPGGDTWTDIIHEPILSKVEQCLEEGILVAAICGATTALAQKGWLDSRYHTSNDLEFLKMICPAYAGEEYYMKEPAVTDGKLITASGIAPLEFSLHVLRALDVFSSQTLDAWYNLYRTREPEHFYALMNSIQ